jgi:hypothetical protein
MQYGQLNQRVFVSLLTGAVGLFEFGADPVRIGLVSSLNRPGANLTGVSSLKMDPKRLIPLHRGFDSLA